MNETAEDLSGQRVGNRRIERPLSRGGHATVYLAHRDDGQYEQRVALKVLRRGLDTDDVIARFRAERQVLSSLEHPAIAQIMDGGTLTGIPLCTVTSNHQISWSPLRAAYLFWTSALPNCSTRPDSPVPRHLSGQAFRC